MMERSKADLTDRAFRLAYFIVPDKTAALAVVTEACAKLEVTAAAQKRRQYYRPSRRRRVRNRVSFRRLHLLQRLIYRESEPHERRKEAAGHRLHEDDLTVSFVKHLVRITLRRNSFYVALGLGRLLHRYDTEETMSVYSLVVQDPDRSRDDYYYRSRKQLLLRELRARFGPLLRTSRGRRGEERPEADDDPGRRGGLVVECLRRFVPWETECVVPERFDPFVDELGELRFDGGDPDAEHPVEIRRIHSLLHPECYLRLMRALSLDDPRDRLAVPRFHMTASSDDGDPGNEGGDRLQPPELTAGERIELTAALAQRASRRRRMVPRLLTITVDGVEAAHLDPGRAASVRFELPENAEILEVWGRDRDGETLLAAHFLTDLERLRRPLRSRVELEGGQLISFALRRAPTDGRCEAEVGYRETRPLRVAELLGQRMRSWLARRRQAGHRMVWGLATLTVAALGFLVIRSGLPLDTPRRDALPQTDELIGDDTRTRGHDAGPAGATLAQVEQIHVGSPVDLPFGRRLRELLNSGLTDAGRLAPTREQADAVLKAKPPNDSPGVTVVLVNRDGTILWRGAYLGPTEAIAEQLLRDLDAAIRASPGAP